MKEFVEEYHIEEEKMTVSSAHFETKERMADDDLVEYDPEEENTVELEQQNLPSDTGEDSNIESNACLTLGIRIKTKVIS